MVRERLTRDLPIERHALAVAAWMRYVAGSDERGRPLDVRDPLAAELAAIARAAGPVPERLASALLGVAAVFGADLSADPRVRAPVTEALTRLYALGANRAAMMAA